MPLFRQSGVIANGQASLPVIITKAGPSIYQHPNPETVKSIPGNALIDTGANVSAIAWNVIQALGLEPNGKIPISGVAGTKPTNTYRINIYIPMIQDKANEQSGILQNLNTNAVELSNEAGFTMLLGMDIIQHCVLVIDKNQFTLTHGKEERSNPQKRLARSAPQGKGPMRTEHISTPAFEYPSIGGTPEADGSRFIAVENSQGTFMQVRLVNTGPSGDTGAFIMKHHVPNYKEATKFTDLRSLASIFLSLEETNRYWFYRCLPNGEARLLNSMEITAKMAPNTR